MSGREVHVKTAGKETADYYLTGDINAASDYINLFLWLSSAGPEDVMFMHINSPGGDLYSCLQIINAIRTSEATVVGIAEGACMSAASFIFLACDQQEVMPYAEFMFHDVSGFTGGKVGESLDELGSVRKLYDLLVDDIYGGVLTEQEIEKLRDGKDYYFLAADMLARLGLNEE